MVTNAGYLRPFLDGSRFLYGVGDNPRTLCDLAMSRLSAELRSTENWWCVYQDWDVRQRWLEEALSKRWQVGPLSSSIEIGLTKKQIEYVLDELAGYASLRDQKCGAQVSCFDRIWESDTLLTRDQHSRLLTAMGELRNGLPMLDSSRSSRVLVDPYRHSLVYGRTLTSAPANPPENVDYCVSFRYAALPTDVAVSIDGNDVKCLSYVNGVDPALTDVNNALEVVLGAFIRLFERVLTELHRNNPLVRRITASCRYTEWDEPEPPEDSDDEEAWQQHIQEFELWEMNRPIQIPDIPSSGYPGHHPRRDHEVILRGRRIQVIFNVNDIQLGPDKPEIPETDWHVEGMKNERIVGCAFYFCNMENILGCCVEFRMAVTSPQGFLPGDTGATLRTWGMRDGDSCNQSLGSVAIRACRGIAFPNIYQHRITTMRLADATRRGQLTILSIFLIDPEAPPIISTTDVPPQQRRWIYQALERSLDERLPTEIIERIMSNVDNLMTEDEAEWHRQEMQEERDEFQKTNDANYFSLPFDVWNT